MTIWQGPAIVCRGGVGAHQGRARFGCYHLLAMGVSTGLCHELAALARLSLTEAEAQLFARQLEPILTHLQQLQSVDVDGIADAGADGGGVRLRDDEARLPLPQSRALAGAPTEHGHVVVPKFKNV